MCKNTALARGGTNFFVLVKLQKMKWGSKNEEKEPQTICYGSENQAKRKDLALRLGTNPWPLRNAGSHAKLWIAAAESRRDENVGSDMTMKLRCWLRFGVSVLYSRKFSSGI